MDATSQSAGQTFEAVLATLGRQLDQLTAGQHGIGDEVRRLSDSLSTLRERIGELERRTSCLDDRFTKILAEKHQQDQPGTLTQDSYQQFQLAGDLNALFTDIDREYRTAYHSVMGEMPALKLRATVLHELLNWQLKDNQESKSAFERFWNVDKAGGEAVAQLISRITALRREAERLDASSEFCFDPRREAEADRQVEPWLRCDPAQPIRFAVTPSYLSGPHCFLPQQVYTEETEAHSAVQ